MTAIAKSLFSISLEECRFIRRGFWSGNTTASEHLESVGEAFLAGYNMALKGEEQLQLAEIGRAHV